MKNRTDQNAKLDAMNREALKQAERETVENGHKRDIEAIDNFTARTWK